MTPVPLIPTLSTQSKLNSGKQLCINSLHFANKQDYACSCSLMGMRQILETIPNNCPLTMEKSFVMIPSWSLVQKNEIWHLLVALHFTL